MTSLKDEIIKTINAASCRQYFELELGSLPPMNTSGECQTRCPLHGHEDNDPSFSINFFKGQFYCHGCKVGGDVFEFVSLNWIQAAIARGFKPDSYSASNIGLPVRI